MVKKIKYIQHGSIFFINPSPFVDFTLSEIAEKDVPEGCAWEIVNREDLPEPPEPTPEQLRALMPRKSMVELRAALRTIRTPSVPDGIYSDDIYEKISLIADRDLREEATDFFDHGQYAERLNPWVDILGAMFGISPLEIDVGWMP